MGFGSLGSSSVGADAATVANAISLLAAVSDPEAAKRILDALAAGLKEMEQRQAAAAAAEAKNVEQLKALVETERAQQARAAELERTSRDLSQHQTRIDVAAGALSERETKISAREAAASALEATLATDTAALASRIESYKKALSA